MLNFMSRDHRCGKMKGLLVLPLLTFFPIALVTQAANVLQTASQRSFHPTLCVYEGLGCLSACLPV